jgi:hypothetical protein
MSPRFRKTGVPGSVLLTRVRQVSIALPPDEGRSSAPMIWPAMRLCKIAAAAAAAAAGEV